MKTLLFALSSLALVGTTPVSAATLPDEIRVQARYVDSADPLIMKDDDGSVVTVFMATVEPVSFSFDPHDMLDLGHASQREFLDPQLNGCQLQDQSFDYISSYGTQIINFGAREPKGQKSCQTFLKAMARGARFHFTNVPLHNRHDVIKSVFVTITK